jgi:DNA (cytosine-5)-methyltransferase 1
MSGLAYYNEIDSYCAEWLRNLIAAGHIAPGVVDTRSIEDVLPGDLKGFTQCHFFAGIGVWSHALRLAGMPDDRPLWTGSCPCQPFSAAGPGAGFDDERHLWPHFHHLISQCRPAKVLGEQVASKDGREWLDLVATDLEGSGYAFGAANLCAAGVGAPHIRQRLFWVADANDAGLEGRAARALGRQRATAQRGGRAGGVADATRIGRRQERAHAGGLAAGDCAQGLPAGPGAGGGDQRTGPTNGFWRDADWLACRDAKWRPVEPGSFPLAHGAAGRVGRVRAYGNAISPQVAAAFIGAALGD